MKTTYCYSILKYRHSLALGEVFNLGLLFFHAETQTVKFRYPHRLKRVSKLYPDFSIEFINVYLRSFERKAEKLSEHFNNNMFGLSDLGFMDLIHEQFLVEDDSALYFDPVHVGITDNHEFELNSLFETYFSSYGSEGQRGKKDEEFIKRSMFREFRDKFHKDPEKLKVETTLTNDRLSEKFEFCWKNGTHNLIAPVSFDLVESSSIKEKGVRWFGTITALANEIEKAEAKIDILTIKPEGLELIKEYDKALKLISSAAGNKQIITEDEMPSYFQHVADYL